MLNDSAVQLIRGRQEEAHFISRNARFSQQAQVFLNGAVAGRAGPNFREFVPIVRLRPNKMPLRVSAADKAGIQWPGHEIG